MVATVIRFWNSLTFPDKHRISPTKWQFFALKLLWTMEQCKIHITKRSVTIFNCEGGWYKTNNSKFVRFFSFFSDWYFKDLNVPWLKVKFPNFSLVFKIFFPFLWMIFQRCNVPWLKVKFPNFSVILKSFIFPDFFLTCGNYGWRDALFKDPK